MTENDITIFRDIKDTLQPFYRKVSVILKRIRDGASKDLVKQIRVEKDKEKRNLLKQKLPAICFSGTFSKRADAAILKHSGLICLDFDGYKTQKELLIEKEKLSKDKYVYSVFISPSGKGLKALIKIPPNLDNHKKYFNSLEKYFESPRFDKTSKNISRVCYESFDPLIHTNDQSYLWDKIIEKEHDQLNKTNGVPILPITDDNKIIEILMKWWIKNHGMIDGERNNNVYVLAAAFNRFGINQSTVGYVMKDFVADDFTMTEIDTIIRSAYSKTGEFGTQYYEDEDKVNLIKEKLRRGVSKKDIRVQLEESSTEVGDLDGVINRLDNEQSSCKFWTKSEKGVIKIFHLLFKNFLEDNGFYKFNPEGSSNYVFVKVTNNLIDHTTEKDIKDFILGHLLELDDVSIYNYFADNTRYFKEEFLTLLASIDVYFIEDTKHDAYLYYKNCAVKVTKETITPIDYIDLGGYVWKDHVIDRDFTICDAKECDYQVFVRNISGSSLAREQSMRSTIGFLLHAWKNLSYCPATILNDEVISDNPEGGTGKGLFMTGLSQMKKLVVIDGKSFNFEKSFAYQLVSADTQILCFDDVRKHFDFERLFSVVTEGLTLEKKNKDAIKIPFSKSPKIAITTNYAIRGKGSSFERRKWELELNQYYTQEYSPLVEFGKLMFGEWSEGEWCQFDNYMISNLQLYLDKGLLKSEFVNLKIRRLSAETCHEFIEWCGLLGKEGINELLIKDAKTYKADLYGDFTSDNPDFVRNPKMTISRTKFNKWLVSFGVFQYGRNPEEGRDSRGRWLRYLSKHTLEKTGTLEF